jgi:hypothetical protein
MRRHSALLERSAERPPDLTAELVACSDVLEPSHQGIDVTLRDFSASDGPMTEVRAAAEGALRVDAAPATVFQKRAGALVRLDPAEIGGERKSAAVFPERPPAGGDRTLHSGKLDAGEIGLATGDPEATTLGRRLATVFREDCVRLAIEALELVEKGR